MGKWNQNIFRFANLIKLYNGSIDNILGVVTKIKYETPLDMSCDNNNILSSDVRLSQVSAVEQILEIDPLNQIEALTDEELQTAAEMFIYLNSCPTKWSKSWSSFYKDLFLTQPTNQIILTLNRMMKTKRSEDGKLRAEKLMKRTSNLLSLNFERIQSLLPETCRNGSVKVPEGAQINNFENHFSSVFQI